MSEWIAITSGGRLRTYLGIAPGVGKTYEMLRDARARRRAGVDAVVAYRERHGRAATAAQLDDLEILPTRTVTYRGVGFAELDVAAVLDRGPELAVVDELAHANLPGERHEKRWNDVGELLANGIDVYTTLNVANIESLGALVARITGVHPAEPVPDGFVRAGEIKLVDLAPAALRRRLAQGLIVPQERVDAALSSYFRFANLAALRELARLWLDDAVPDAAEAFLAARGISQPVQASVIVVGLDGSPADEWLIRYAAQLAGLSDARLRGVHVRDIDNLGRAPTARLEQDRQLLSELHGSLVEVRADDIASGLIRAARRAGACQLVIGSRRRSRWSRLLTGVTVADQVLRAAGDLPVQVVNVGRPGKTSDEQGDLDTWADPGESRDGQCVLAASGIRSPGWEMSVAGRWVRTSVTSASIISWPVAIATETRWWPSLTKCRLPTRNTSIGGITAPSRSATSSSAQRCRSRSETGRNPRRSRAPCPTVPTTVSSRMVRRPR
jgi:two-component system, OmpR family, sensor histidine kinase KdpD